MINNLKPDYTRDPIPPLYEPKYFVGRMSLE